MQPITVRPAGDAFEIVAGERRWRAHCLLRDMGKLPSGTIDAIVREIDDRQRDIEAIIENMARADITPMEEARAFRRMVDQGMTPQELAKALGITQPWRVTDRLRLFNLAPEFQRMFEGGQLNAEAVYEISRLESHAAQTKIVQAINRGQLVGYKAVRSAVLAIIEGLDQQDIFGGGGAHAKPTDEEIAKVSGMERAVDTLARLSAAGFDAGEVVIARRVAPDRAKLMADRLSVIRKQVLLMENQLREAAAQAAAVLH